MLATPVRAEQAHVVQEPSGRVVLVCWGNDAVGVAAHWAARGYRVHAVDRDGLGVE